MIASGAAEAWIDQAIGRHTRDFSTPEFLKAVRALSARYVERRADLGRRSPVDSAGKRAAFAGFFAPIHFLTARAAVEALGIADARVDHILDLGCGSGAVSAAWASAAATTPDIVGVDRDGWALDEAAWTWRTLGLNGRTRRGDLVAALAPDRRGRARHDASTGIVLGWSANELAASERAALLEALGDAMSRGAQVLVIEPISGAAVPWWQEWASAWTRAGGRADLWKFTPALPPALAALSDAAGFRRDALGARTLWSGQGRGRPAPLGIGS
jgi:hypothetical protein